jgi:hypothetical protein
VLVSTIFLAIDYAFGDGPPILFETMIFCDDTSDFAAELDHEQRRYCTWEEAKSGHDVWVRRVIAKQRHN